MTCEEVRELLGAFSLHALDVDERDVVEHHIARCPECAAELRAYTETVGMLARAVPVVEPSAAVRARVLAGARRMDSARVEAPVGRRAVEMLGWLRARAVGMVAAAALVVAGGALGWGMNTSTRLQEQVAANIAVAQRAAQLEARLQQQSGATTAASDRASSLQAQLDQQIRHVAELEQRSRQLQQQLQEQQSQVTTLGVRAERYDRVVAVLQSPGMQARQMQGTDLAPSAFGRMWVDPSTGNGMMMVRSLPRLQPGRVYQLWWVNADGRRETGGFIRSTDQEGAGYSLIRCPGEFRDWTSFGITEEPEGGSPAPTGRRLVGGTV